MPQEGCLPRDPDVATLREWFARRVKREARTGCLLWTGARGNGYGLVRYWVAGRRIRVRAHKLAWELAKGPVPKGLCVCHQCDTPLCMNTAHHFLGTNADNVADRVRKGRQRNRALVERLHVLERVPNRPDTCMAGHPWTPENTYVRPDGVRTCRRCKLRRQGEHRARKQNARRTQHH